MKTIIFKPEFEKKLKRLGIKRKFVNTIRQSLIVKHGRRGMTTNGTIEEICIGLNTLESFRDFIKYAFYFEVTPDGDSYWRNIANSFKKK